MYAWTLAVIEVLIPAAPLTPATTGFLNEIFQAPHWVDVPLPVTTVVVIPAALETAVGEAVAVEPDGLADGEPVGVAVSSAVSSAVGSAVGSAKVSGGGGSAVSGARESMT
jgi:hypothetical protein